MAKAFAIALSEAFSFLIGEWHRYPDNKHEGRLNQIPERDPEDRELAVPFGMGSVEDQELGESSLPISCRTRQAEAGGGEEEHDHSPIDIEGEDSI